MAVEKHWAIDLSEAHALIAEEAAMLTLRGIGINEQVKILRKSYPGPDLTRTKLVTLKRHPKYLEVYKNKADEMVTNGQIQLKTGAADLVPAVIACLKTRLAEGDVKAAVAVVNILTEQKQEDGQKQAQQLQIIMPGVVKELKP